MSKDEKKRPVTPVSPRDLCNGLLSEILAKRLAVKQHLSKSEAGTLVSELCSVCEKLWRRLELDHIRLDNISVKNLGSADVQCSFVLSLKIPPLSLGTSASHWLDRVRALADAILQVLVLDANASSSGTWSPCLTAVKNLYCPELAGLLASMATLPKTRINFAKASSCASMIHQIVCAWHCLVSHKASQMSGRAAAPDTEFEELVKRFEAVVEYETGLARERGSDGLASSWKEAFAHYTKAESSGSQEAAYKVALALAYGLGAVDQNLPKARDALQAIDHANVPGATALLAEIQKDPSAVLKATASQQDCLLDLFRSYRDAVSEESKKQIASQQLFDRLLPKVLKLAEDGDVHAQFRLGCSLLRRNDTEAAVKWLCAATNQHCAPAQLLLGTLHVQGRGVDKNEPHAMTLYQSAFKQGIQDAEAQAKWSAFHTNEGIAALAVDPVVSFRQLEQAVRYDKHKPACAYLAIFHLFGMGATKINEKRAIERLQQAENEPLAKSLMAICLTHGLGVDANRAQAAALDASCSPSTILDFTDQRLDVQLYPPQAQALTRQELFDRLMLLKRAASFGHAWAQYALAVMETKSADRAAWQQKAREQGFKPPPLFLAARHLEAGMLRVHAKCWNSAFKHFNKALELGEQRAAYPLALCHLFGLTSFGVNEKKGFQMAHQAKALGSPSLLAECYVRGWGCAVDLKKAVALLESADIALDPLAGLLLGKCLSIGLAVRQDLEKSDALVSSAMRVLNELPETALRSNYALADCFMRGNGVRGNAKRALQLLSNCVEQGHRPAQHLLRRWQDDYVTLVETVSASLPPTLPIPTITPPGPTGDTRPPVLADEKKLPPIPIDLLPGDYLFQKNLGGGMFGCVLQVKNISNGMLLALKLFLRIPGCQDDERAAVREANRLMSCDGKNVAKVRGIGFLTRNPGPDWLDFWIAIELCDTNMHRMIVDRCTLKHPLSKAEAFDWTLQLCAGLQVIHRQGILHRDIKLDNILVQGVSSGKLVVKFSDFGLSRSRPTFSIVHNYWPTLAPEMRNIPDAELRLNSPYSKHVDIYALGVVLMQILLLDENASRSRQASVHLQKIAHDYGEELAGLICWMISTVPANRSDSDACLVYANRIAKSLKADQKSPHAQDAVLVRGFRSTLEYEQGLVRERGSDGNSASWKDAIVHYNKAMELGSEEAAYKMALAYFHGLGDLRVDWDAAFLLLSTLPYRDIPGAAALFAWREDVSEQVFKCSPYDCMLKMQFAFTAATGRNGVTRRLDIAREAFDSVLLRARALAEDDNDVHAQFMLALCWLVGAGPSLHAHEALAFLAKAASQGSAFALGLLGHFYRFSRADNKEDQAASLYAMAVDRAMFWPSVVEHLADFHCLAGLRAMIDAKQQAVALDHFTKASRYQSDVGQACLGYFHLAGMSVATVNAVSAHECLRSAARLPLANELLALCQVHFGVASGLQLTNAQLLAAANCIPSLRGVMDCRLVDLQLLPNKQATMLVDRGNFTGGVDRLHTAAAFGNAWAQRALAIMLPEADLRERWQTKAAAQKFVDSKSYAAARSYEAGVFAELLLGDWSKAFPHFETAYNLAEPAAAYKLAQCFLFGLNVKKIDEKRAFNLLETAVAARVPGACSLLAECYINGWGTEPDEQAAVLALMFADLAADPFAGLLLGQCLIDGGLGTERNEAEGQEMLASAVHTITQLAEQGDVRAQYELALCLNRGTSGAVNNRQALAWMERAVAQGHAEAQRTLACWLKARLCGLVSSRDVIRARELLAKAASQRACDSSAQTDGRVIYVEHNDDY